MSATLTSENHRPRILGTGKKLPKRQVSNTELTSLLETDESWIEERTGILNRRFASVRESPASLAEQASQRALQNAGVAAGELDCILVATLSPEHSFPGTACFLQERLKLPGIPAIDLRTQCTGFLTGLKMAEAFILAGHYHRILLVGTEVQSTGLDLTPRGRAVSVLFGDGAGAAIIGNHTTGPELLGTILHADGRFAKELWCEKPSSAQHPQRITIEDLKNGTHFPQMNGRTVFRHAIKNLEVVINEILSAHNLKPSDVDLMIPHQANKRLNEMVARRFKLSEKQVYHNIQHYGNTTSASIPIALDECVRLRLIKKGMLVCLPAFGSGFTWGASLIRW